MAIRLTELPFGREAAIRAVEDTSPTDPIAVRLRNLGFVRNEHVRIVARGPIGADPLLIQIGFTRFALRRSEAARVLVEPIAA
jgi:ferrous iron transport protein A